MENHNFRYTRQQHPDNTTRLAALFIPSFCYDFLRCRRCCLSMAMGVRFSLPRERERLTNGDRKVKSLVFRVLRFQTILDIIPLPLGNESLPTSSQGGSPAARQRMCSWVQSLTLWISMESIVKQAKRKKVVEFFSENSN